MTKEKLERANELERKIHGLEQDISAISPSWESAEIFIGTNGKSLTLQDDPADLTSIIELTLGVAGAVLAARKARLQEEFDSL